MPSLQKLLKPLLLVWSIALLQCGQANGISSKINFTITPKSPVVILADLTLNPGTATEKKITAPWYALSFSVTNDSASAITIQSLAFKTTAITKTGALSVKETATDAADYPNSTYLETVPANSSLTANYIIYIGSNEKEVFDYSYSVEVSVQGWIGTPTAPEDRLIKTVSFVTK